MKIGSFKNKATMSHETLHFLVNFIFEGSNFVKAILNHL